MSIVNWSEHQLDTVVKSVVKQLASDQNLPLWRALSNAQTQYIPKVDRMSEATMRQYPNHSQRLRAALQAAGVVYGAEVGKPTTLESNIKKREFAAKWGIRVVHPKPSPVVRPPEPDTQRPQVEDDSRQTFQVELVPPPQPVVPKKPALKFVIIGFEPDKAQDVMRRARRQHELLLTAEFRFWKDENPKRLDNWLEWADAAVMMTRWIGHDSQRKAQTHPNHVFCNGSVSGVVTVLHNLANQLAKTV